jgi:hypothetical protein
MPRFWIIEPGGQPQPLGSDDDIDLPDPIGPIIVASLTKRGVLFPSGVIENLASVERDTGQKQPIVLYVGPGAGQHEMNVASALGTTWNRTVFVDEAKPGYGVFDRRRNRRDAGGS